MDAMPRLGDSQRRPTPTPRSTRWGGVGHLMARGTAFLLPFSGRGCCASSSVVRSGTMGAGVNC
jgi:hypothetical protein